MFVSLVVVALAQAPPAPAPAGRSPEERRAIYAEMHRAGALAGHEARWLIPDAWVYEVADAKAAARRRAVRKAAYDDLKRAGRHKVIVARKLDGRTLDAIVAEGDREKWPVPDVPDPRAGEPRPTRPDPAALRRYQRPPVTAPRSQPPRRPRGRRRRPSGP